MSRITDTHNDILRNVMGDDTDVDTTNDDVKDLLGPEEGTDVDDELDIDPDQDQNQDENNEQQADDGTDTEVVEAKKPTKKPEKQPRKQEEQDGSKDFDKFNPDHRLKEDKAGNLLGPDGRILVRRGSERRLFEEARSRISKETNSARRLAVNLRQLATESRGLFDRYKQLHDQKNMFDQAELSFDEQKQMLDIATEFKKNPIDGIKKFLTMAHMQGIDISKLGVGGGLDTRFVVDSLKEHVTKQLQPQPTSERADPEAEANQFLSETPEAWDFAEEVGAENFGKWMDAAKKQFPNESYKALFEGIRLHYYRSQAARKNEATTSVEKKSKPSSPPRGENRSNKRNRNHRSSGSESFDDIGRDVLRDLKSLNR